MEAGLQIDLSSFFKSKLFFSYLILMLCSPLFFCSRVLDDGRCVVQCPRGKFEFNKQCHSCHESCTECSGSEPNECTSCAKGKAFSFFLPFIFC